MKNDIIFLQEGKNFLPHFKSVFYFIETWHIQHSKLDLLAFKLVNNGLVKVDFFGDLLGAVGHKDGRISSQQFGCGRFAGSRSSEDEEVKTLCGLHFQKP